MLENDKEVSAENLSINSCQPNIYYSSSEQTLSPVGLRTETSPRRHVILILFVLSAALNGFPFSHNFVGGKFAQYYNTTDSNVDLLAFCFMGAFILSFYTANWLFETRGLRFGVLMGLFFNTIGGWLFLASLHPSMFWVAVVAQAIIGLGQPFMLNVPPYLASIWFPAHEVSRACATASFAQPLGTLTGVAALPFVLRGTDFETLHQQFLWYHVVYACVISVILLISLFVFKGQPKHPPSLARAEIIRNPPKPCVNQSIKTLLMNSNYRFHLVAFGFMNGVQNGYISILNQIILKIHPDAGSSFWKAGLILCMAGVSSCLSTGLILDKTHRYKETAFGLIFCSAVACVIWTFVSPMSLIAMFSSSFFLGFFMTGYIPAGLELSAEISYPVSEVTTTSLLTAIGCIMGIILTFLGSWTLDTYGALVTNLTFLAFMLIGLVITAFVKSDLRRLRTNIEGTTREQC